MRWTASGYVKAYVKRNKNDAADAEAICEAVTRPTMRFVPIKSAEAQSLLMVQRARHLLVRQRTAQASAMRAHLAEYGFVAARGMSRLRDLLPALDASAGVVPELARQTLLLIAQLIEALTLQIRKIDTELLRWHRRSPESQRLETIPGVGFITATAMAATVRDARAFPIRKTVRRLARPRAASELQRRQGPAGRDLQDGRPLPAPPAGDRCDCGRPLYAAENYRHKPLGKPAPGAQACPAGHPRRRQHGADRWAVMARQEAYRAAPAAT
jgi:hypothetical protein